MRTLTTVEQTMICGAGYDGNEKLEQGRFFLYDIGGALLGGLAGAQAASMMNCYLLGQGIGLMVGMAGGTILGQFLNKLVSAVGQTINE